MVLNYRVIIKLVGIIIIILASSMLPSLVVSLIYKETDVANAFIQTIIPMLILGGLLFFKVRADSTHLKIREGYTIVALCWIIGSILGAIPFTLSGYLPNFVDAIFETASGFSTTGASILTDIEALPKGLLFWRSYTHWLGGMGIIVFAIALLPAIGISSYNIAKAETSGPSVGKLTPKLSDSFKILYFIYIGFTILEVILLMLGDMNLYDALIHTFGSVATGGFSNYNDSVAHFNSVYIEMVITVFMFLAGINFTLYYFILRGHWLEFFHDNELRFYLLIMGSCILLMGFNLWYNNIYDSFSDALRYSSFHSAAIMTTTGFMSADYDLWPSFSKMILLILMFIGGSSASTSGGMKVIRILILLKLVKRGIALRLHPRAIISIKLGSKPLTADTVSAVANFSFLYFVIFFVGIILVSLENFDLLTTVSAVAACISNIGPGFSLVGPTMNYSFFSDISKLFLALLMLIGRLELFTIILLFTKQFWNPDK